MMPRHTAYGTYGDRFNASRILVSQVLTMTSRRSSSDRRSHRETLGQPRAWHFGKCRPRPRCSSGRSLATGADRHILSMTHNKKLIEVALPLEAINKASALEKQP